MQLADHVQGAADSEQIFTSELCGSDRRGRLGRAWAERTKYWRSSAGFRY